MMHRTQMSVLSYRTTIFVAVTLLTLLTFLSTSITSVNSQYAFLPSSSSDVCTSTQRYDSSSLTCEECNSITSTGLIRDTADRERCICTSGKSRTFDSTNVVSVTCTACSSGQVPLRDQSMCVVCAGGVGIDATTQDCACPSGNIIVEYDLGGTLFSDGKHCQACASGTQVFQSPSHPLYNLYKCQACPDTDKMSMDSDGVCTCKTGYAKVSYGTSEVCLLTTALSQVTATYSPITAAVMKYNDVRSSDSSNRYSYSPPLSSNLILRYFGASSTNCLTGHDRHACQTLANMCVLQKYSQSSTACLAFQAVFNSLTDFEHGFTGEKGWKSSLPFLYRSPSIMSTSNSLIKQEVTLSNIITSDNTKTGFLTFRLYKYDFNGTYLGYEVLGQQLQLCGGDPKLLGFWTRFGTNYINTCQLDLTPFATLTSSSTANTSLTSGTIFYDPYLVDTSGQIYPIPVKVLNTQSADGDTPNRDSDGNEVSSDTNILSRRFYLVDVISGIDTPNSRPKVISFLKTALLRVEMLGTSNSEMRVPLLVLDYSERATNDILDGGSQSFSQVTFQVEYVKTTAEFWRAVYGLFGTCLILSLVVVVRRLWIWSSHNGTDYVQITFFLFLRFIIYLFSALGELFFLMIVCLSFYVWIFYKGQKTVYYLLPSIDSSETYQLRNFIIICFVAKLCDVAFKLYQQITQVDVFFMDWEKPKGSNNIGGVGGGGFSPDGSPIQSSDDDTTSGSPHSSTSVSVWRKLFAANKWNDLQSTRLVNVPFTLFVMIFLMESNGLGLKYLATAQPSSSNLDATAAPLHPILSFAVNTFFLLILCYGQLLYHTQITHRYFKDEIAQFVDLLCTSNISCMILDEYQHGFYIHGKTVHPYADISLEEMTEALQYEEKTLTRERGLLPGKDCFEIYLTYMWRKQYDELYTRLLQKQSIHQARQQRANARGGMQAETEIELGRTVARGGGMNTHTNDRSSTTTSDTTSLISSALLRANASLNHWLTSFINREPQFPYPYDIGEYDSVRQMLGLPVALGPQAPCTLYDDPSYGFTSVLMCGMERDLILFLILLYSFCNVLFNSILVATLVCFVVDRLMVGFRSHWGQINISKKTLLDERFLI